MVFRRYTAANSREAMRLVRDDLGDDAVIMASRKTASGSCEIVAAPADAVDAMVEDARPPEVAATAAAAAAAPAAAPARVGSVESFEQFLRRQGQPSDAARPASRPAPAAPAASARPAAARQPEAARVAAIPARRLETPRAPARTAQAVQTAAEVGWQAPPAPPAPPAPVALAAADSRQLVAELQSLRSALQEQLSALTTNLAVDSARRNPLAVRLMTRLLTAGFSPELARRVAHHAPADLQPGMATEWLCAVLEKNLRCADTGSGLIDRPGVYALVGPTGVGKTTTVAKLAARFAVTYGTNALSLITLDAYRVAAREQLQAYGRILGTPVHLVQDTATLQELLGSLRGKQLVLIDTCGVGPRDERLGEMLAMLAQAGRDSRPVQPVLLLNAGSHAETLDETARAWQAQQAAGCILTKLDEAARIGGALDCVLRHKLTLLGVTNGQRVPEDLQSPNARLLTHVALKAGAAPFALEQTEAAALAVAQ